MYWPRLNGVEDEMNQEDAKNKEMDEMACERKGEEIHTCMQALSEGMAFRSREG